MPKNRLIIKMKKAQFVGRNTNRLKAHNVQAILLNLLHNQSASRVQLAEQTALSKTTITNLIAELIDEGIIAEKTMAESAANEPRRIGRPRRMLSLVPDSRYVVGVHVGIGLLRVAITNLCAEIIHNTMDNFEIETPAEQALETMGDMIEAAIVESQIDRDRVMGIGVGVSGLVDHEQGINLYAPRLGWRDIPVLESLESRLNLPVCVDNNVRAMAIGEAFFGVGKGVDTLTFIYGRIGVGAGLVVNGQVFRGSGVGAGEIGHTIMIPARGLSEPMNKVETLETLVSEPIFIRDAQRIAAENPTGLLAAALQDTKQSQLIEHIFQAARDGDQITREMIAEKAYYLGIALANLVNILNPELIILGGLFAQGHDVFLPIVEKTMKQMAFASLGDNVRLQATSFGWRAGVKGAAALALTNFFYQPPTRQHI